MTTEASAAPRASAGPSLGLHGPQHSRGKAQTSLVDVLQLKEIAKKVCGEMASSPLDSLALACTSKAVLAAMEEAWPLVRGVYEARWTPLWDAHPPDKRARGRSSAATRNPSADSAASAAPAAPATSAEPAATSRRSARLVDAHYYEPRFAFVRLVELAARNAFAVHNELYQAASGALPFTSASASHSAPCKFTETKLRRVLHEFSPVWCDARTGVKGASLLLDVLLSRAVPRNQALACVRLLVEERSCDVHARGVDGMQPLGAAAARGLDDVVVYLLSRCSCRKRCLDAKCTGQFVASNGRVVRGTLTPLAWSTTMLEAEKRAGVPMRQLARLLRCVDVLTKADCDRHAHAHCSLSVAP